MIQECCQSNTYMYNREMSITREPQPGVSLVVKCVVGQVCCQSNTYIYNREMSITREPQPGVSLVVKCVVGQVCCQSNTYMYNREMSITREPQPGVSLVVKCVVGQVCNHHYLPSINTNLLPYQFQLKFISFLWVCTDQKNFVRCFSNWQWNLRRTPSLDNCPQPPLRCNINRLSPVPFICNI